jgi:hypothetical protein
MEERVDINSEASVERMFAELVRDHAEAEPLSTSPPARRCRATKPPPVRHSMIPRFWAVGDGADRIAELRDLLAEPDVLSPAAPTFFAPSVTPERHAPSPAGWTLAPVAMGSVAPQHQSAAPPAGAQLLRWLVPATAGAFAVGAVYAADGLRPPTSSSLAALTPPRAEGAYLTSDRWDAAEDYSAWALQLMRRPALTTHASTLDAFVEEPSTDSVAAGMTRPASIVQTTAARLSPSAPRAANLRALTAATAARGAEATAPEQAPTMDAEPQAEPELGPFDRQAALASLRQAAGAAQGCATAAGGTHLVPITVTFAPSGRVTVAQVGGAFAGKSTGSCVAQIMRAAQVPPFSGSHVSVSKTVRFR